MFRLRERCYKFVDHVRSWISAREREIPIRNLNRRANCSVDRSLIADTHLAYLEMFVMTRVVQGLGRRAVALTSNTGRGPLARMSTIVLTKDLERAQKSQEVSLRENCILVDVNDRATGHASKRDCHRVGDNGSLLLHRAFSVFLFNTQGEMLVQRRSSHKVGSSSGLESVSQDCYNPNMYEIRGPKRTERTMDLGHDLHLHCDYADSRSPSRTCTPTRAAATRCTTSPTNWRWTTRSG